MVRDDNKLTQKNPEIELDTESRRIQRIQATALQNVLERHAPFLAENRSLILYRSGWFEEKATYVQVRHPGDQFTV